MTPLEIVGASVGILIAAAAVFCAFGYMLDGLYKIVLQRSWARADHGMREAGVRIVQDAHWFSESPNAFNALVAAGEWFRDNGNRYDPEKVRARWRALNKASPSEYSK
jgi:hypothetical protein